ncbi:MAG: hypothetical protein CMJ32_11910 [Phycisphaerae bacterium]|nr:hypothetical protein [Phycisphaerae bacterium]
MMNRFRINLVALLCLTIPTVAHAQFPGISNPLKSDDKGFVESSDAVTITIIPLQTALPAGNDLPVAIIFDIADKWHIWTNRNGVPEGADRFTGAQYTSIEVTGGSGGLNGNVEFIQWPQPHLITADLGDGPAEYAVFEGSAAAILPVTIDTSIPPGKVTLELGIQLQACDDTSCLQPSTVTRTIEVTIIGEGMASSSPTTNAAFTDFDQSVFQDIHSGVAAPRIIEFDFFGLRFEIDASGVGFVLLLLVAFIGGLLLNFTPCVLPVIPIKIMGLAQSAGNRRQCFMLGLTMSFGVMFFWLLLGAVIAFVKSFTATSQLFQYPVFTISIGVVIAIMAIGMSGFFSVRLPSVIYRFEPKHDSYLGSFLFGIMTAILSTPCTAPLMGAAAAWAATQDPGTVLIVFVAIGTGMAMPYLVLSGFPKLVSHMPRTGPASDLIKQVMGLLLLSAAAYFIGAGISGLLVSGSPDPPTRVYWYFVGGIGAIAGGWLFFRSLMIGRKKVAGFVFGFIGLLVILVSFNIAISMTAKGPIDWVYYTKARFENAIDDGKVVLLDFTAEWCLNCKTLEATVLYSDRVAQQINTEGVVPMKIDLTGSNPEGRKMLEEVQRLTIPLLVIFDREGQVIFKSDAYTKQQVIDALQLGLGE